MITIEALTKQQIDPTNEQQYRAWSAHYNHALREAAPQPIIKAKYPKPDANMMVANWCNLQCECRQKVAT